MNADDDNKDDSILSMIKTIWILLAEIADRSKGLSMLAKRIETIVQAYGKDNEEQLLNRLIDLSTILDSAVEVEWASRKELLEAISKLKAVFVNLGVEEIATSKETKFDPKIHCAVAVKYAPEQTEATIYEVVRKGYKNEQQTYVAEVVVATRKKQNEEKAQEIKIGTVGEKQVLYSFDGGDITTDTGVLLLQAVDESIGLVSKIVEAINDNRAQSKITHEVKDLLAQRIYQIALGYEDCNDCNFLRTDPAFKTALKRDLDKAPDLASQPTMSRFENAITEQELIAIRQTQLQLFVESYQSEPEIVVLDIDTTVDPAHGMQQMTLFNAYYDTNCFLPIHLYDGISGKLIMTQLRPGKTPKGSEIVSMIEPVVDYLRKHWKHTILMFRGDSHFSAPEVLEYLENNGLLYVIGASSGSVGKLKQLATLLRQQVENLYSLIQAPIKRYASLCYQAQSWDKPRRIVAKAEFSDMGENTRFIITNIEGKASKVYEDVYCSQQNFEHPNLCSLGKEKAIYEDIYCARGNCENYIKDHKTYLKSDRTSCHRFAANQFRLALHSAAYILLHTFKTQYLENSQFANATFHTIQLRILKVAARVRSLKTRIRFSLPSSYPLQSLWCRISNILFPLRS